MSTTTKPEQIRIRIEPTDIDLLDALAGKVLSRTDIASVLLNAAMSAIRANGGKINFPPHFTVASEDTNVYRLNETPTPRRK